METEQLLLATRLVPEPLKITDKWEVWAVEETTTTDVFKKYFLFLKHGASFSGAAPEVQKLADAKNIPKQHFHAVLSPAHPLRSNKDRIRSDFGVRTIQTPRELTEQPDLMLLNRARKTALGQSLSHLENETFIDPNISIADSREIVQRPREHLAAWLSRSNQDDSGKNLSVLVADGGVGKTWFSRHLEYAMWENWKRGQPIPILLTSAQWKDIETNQRLTFDDILARALTERVLSEISSQVDIEVRNQLGRFAIILDGFDELCAQRTSEFNPRTVLTQLLERQASPEASRIILTTRTTYWEQHIDEETRNRCVVLQMRGFGARQKRDYFQRELLHRTLVDRAAKLADEIDNACYGQSKQPAASERITGVPYVLSLLAQSVKEDAKARKSRANVQLSTETRATFQKEPMRGVLLYLCEREVRRQGLLVTAEEQLQLFSQLATTCGPQFSKDEISYWATEISPNKFCDDKQRQGVLSHVLLRPSGTLYEFRVQMLREQLQAMAIVDHWDDLAFREQLTRMLAESAAGDTLLIDALARRLSHLGGKDAWKQPMIKVCARTKQHGDLDATSGLWQLAQTLLRGEVRRDERTEEMLELMGDVQERSFADLRLTGNIHGFDFKKVRFRNCEFSTCGFFACEFGKTTVFEDCRFLGGIEIGGDCRGGKGIRFEKQDRDRISDVAILGFLHAGVSEAAKLVDELVVDRAFLHVLSEFFTGSAFAPVRQSSFHKSLRAGGKLDAEIRDALRDATVLVPSRASTNTPEVEVSREEQGNVKGFVETGAAFGGVANALAVVRANWCPQTTR